MRGDMFVVVEFNQAGGRPGLLSFSELHDTREDAEDELAAAADHAKAGGRNDSYRIGTVQIDEQEAGE